MQNAAKVGLLVVVFVILLVTAYSFIGKSMFGDKTDDYYAVFPDAGGVREGAQVQMSGVAVGTVAKIELVNPKEAKMTLRLREDVRIPENSTASIPTSLIGLGEKPVQIEPPTDLTGQFLATGSTIPGSTEAAFGGLLEDGKGTVQELTKTLKAVRTLLEDQKLQEKVVTLLETSNKTAEDLSQLLRNANGLLAQNQGRINEALRQGTAAVADVRRVTLQLAQFAESGKLQDNTVGIMEDIRKLTQRSDELLVSMNQLINDPALRGPARESAANLAEITETGVRIAQNTEEITRNGAVVSSNAITMTERANEVLLKASQIEDQLKEVLDKVGGFFGRRPSTGSLSNLEVGMDLIRETDPGHWRTDLNFRLPLPDATVHGGIYDAFETNKWTLQLGKDAGNDLSYRYGIYASKPGFGVDYLFGPKLSLKSDLWDINALRLDLSARYEFGNGVIGWFGVQKLFKDNAPMIGVGVRR